MSRTRDKATDRFLAMLLSIAMLIATLPIGALYVNAAGTSYALYVRTIEDGSAVAVEDATVEYKVTIDPNAEEPEVTGSATTMSGKIDIDLSAYADVISQENPASMDIIVTKDAYKTENITVTITNATGESTVTLTAEEPVVEQHTVSVTISSGDAVVEVDGIEQNSVTVEAGSEVPVKITPADGSYIKEITIDGTPIDVVKGEAYVDTVKADSDRVIAVKIVKEYTVTAPAVEGGTITLNGQEVTSLVVDENTDVSVSVSAGDSYQISSVTIGGIDQDVPAAATLFDTTVPVTADTVVTAVFVKVFDVNVTQNGSGTITVTHNENETVITGPENTFGFVTVETGTQIIVKADPIDDYRVSKVEINDEEAIILEKNFSTNEIYEIPLTADKDYTVAITFAPNRYYDVVCNDNEHVVISNSYVEHNGKVTVTVSPEAGFIVDSVTINGRTLSDLGVTGNNTTGNEFIFTIADITENQEVIATFKANEVSLDNVSFDTGSAIRIDGNTYVYAKGSSVKFSTNLDGIKINGEETDSISETTVISSIEVNDKFFVFDSWSFVKLPEGGITIVIDSSAPIVTVGAVEEKDFYNGDVEISVSAGDIYTEDKDVTIEEKEKYFSGIKSIEYWVTCDGVVTQGKGYAEGDTKPETGIIYPYPYDDVSAERVVNTSIIVDTSAGKNNSDNVVVHVLVTDCAGNERKVTKPLKICTTPPTISVSSGDVLHPEAKQGYYNAARTVEITYVENRKSVFDKDAAIDGIKIEANGEKIDTSNMIEWSEIDGGKTHIARISFIADANYKLDVSYTNKAELSNDGILIQKGDSIYGFTVDTNPPSGTIELDKSTWNDIVSTLTFGLWKNYSVTAEVLDAVDTSGIASIFYYKSNDTKILQVGELEKLFEKGEFTKEKYIVSTDEKFVVYARITDYAGNTLYVSTNGAIVDTTDSVITLVPDEANANGFYNKDVDIAISVSEVVEGKDAYSGIKSIDYKVVKDADYGNPTQSGNLYTFTKINPVYSDLRSTWSSTDSDGKIITVDKDLNNSDDVKVIVTVVDNAGNEYSEETTLAINVDEVKTEITLDGTAYKVVDDRGYYDMEARTATIVISERATAFDKEAATTGISVIAVDANGAVVENAYTISDWKTTGDTHTATVIFTADANYDWSFSYTNKADNALNVSRNLSTGTSITPFKFTVDDTDPTGTITVNTNTWDKLLNVLTFGLYSNVIADVTATSNDATSPVIVEYYKTSNPVAMTIAELDTVSFTEYEDFSIETDEQFVVYLKITDFAGNYVYINSDGYIVDKVSSNITLSPSGANGFYNTENNAGGQYGLYNEKADVTVDIKVEDEEPYSGIKSIEYWVENDDVETQRAVLYSFDYTRESGNNSNGGKLVITDWNSETQKNSTPVIYEGAYPVQDELRHSWEGTVVIDKKLNNSCDVVVYVKTIDNAGNEEINSVKLDIDIVAPTIDVTFDNGNDNNGNTYFDAQRTATIVITERSHHFDEEAATKGIVVTAVDAKGIPVENAYTLSGWIPSEDTENPDEKTYTATLFFEKDANYTWSIAYADKAGNDNVGVTTSVKEGNSIAAFDFTVDTTKPTGTVKAVSSEGRETEWNSLKNNLTFGFWSKEKITISGTSDDVTSAPIAAVEYYKVAATKGNDGTTALTVEELDKITEWKTFEGLEINSDEQFVVYIKITDMAGNHTYISTNGLIVDHAAPMVENVAPEVFVTPVQQNSELYNGDVNISIQVSDPLRGGTYSGLKTVSYSVLNMGTETQSGVLYALENDDPKQSDLLQSWSGNITVDSSLNNSNDVVIVVYAEDNARNSAEGQVAIKIDVTNPTISVNYDNNEADNAKYFKADRTATIVVTERNFDSNDVLVSISNTDGVIPEIGAWSKSEGSGNMDNTTWTTTVTYNADGDYTFGISYTDEANNACTDINYGNSITPTEFTIDKTLPVIAVSYNNNMAQNGKYFAAARTATIVITEHNFDVNRVVFTQTASLNGRAITIPSARWTNNGDVHTATIVYTEDGDYTFDVSVMDMAANESAEESYGNSVAGQDFVVDKTIAKPIIGGVEDGKAYKEDVIPAISFDDVNYDSYEVKLVRTRMGEKNVDVTADFIPNITEQIQGGAGTYDTFEKIVENDGIYTLMVKVFDKAGNVEDEEVTFTVNRFGSVYEYSDYLVSLIKDGGQYIKIEGNNKAAITEDLVITEYNADKLIEGSLKILITRDGEAINAIYTANPTDIKKQDVGESGWYQYVYTIDASNFAEDGVYKITLASEYAASDSEKNESTSVPENSIDSEGNQILDTMNFVVDTKAPEIRNIINLEEAIVNAQTVDVKYTIVDIGSLKSIAIILNGETIDTITEFGDSAFNYSGQFTIDESTEAQTVQILVTDLAGNVTDTAADDFSTGELYVFNDVVTVSTNFLVRWYANKPLFWGSVGGVVIMASAITLIIAAKNKKKEEEE